MVLSRYNEVKLKKFNHAREVNPKESLRMKIFHILWFIGLIVEVNFKKTMQSNLISFLFFIILGSCLIIRIHSMKKLKQFWTIKVLSMQGQKVATEGMYKYIRHPNYGIVILEFIFLPLLFKAYFTMIMFSFLNLFVVYKRIELEERTLMTSTNYQALFASKKRFIPYVF